MPIDPEFLKLLRCPEAVHMKDKGTDPGQLELIGDSWLISRDSGNKYPIRNGIPVMLIEEGRKWRETPIEQLPSVPPAAD